MKKKTLAVLLALILTIVVSMPVFAEESAVSQGTSATTSLRGNKSTTGVGAELRQPGVPEGRSSILETTDSKKVTSNAPSSNSSTTSLTNSDITNQATETNAKVATSSSNLPKAGLSPVITFAIGGIVLLATVLYRKVVKYNI